MKIAIYNRAKKWITIYDQRGMPLCRHYNTINVRNSNNYADTVFEYAGAKDNIVRISECTLIRDIDCEDGTR